MVLNPMLDQLIKRSVAAQLRTGIIPLALKVDRYKNIQEDGRLCELCELGEVENESNFLLYHPSVRNPEMLWFNVGD